MAATRAMAATAADCPEFHVDVAKRARADAQQHIQNAPFGNRRRARARQRNERANNKHHQVAAKVSGGGDGGRRRRSLIHARKASADCCRKLLERMRAGRHSTNKRRQALGRASHNTRLAAAVAAHRQLIYSFVASIARRCARAAHSKRRARRCGRHLGDRPFAKATAATRRERPSSGLRNSRRSRASRMQTRARCTSTVAVVVAVAAVAAAAADRRRPARLAASWGRIGASARCRSSGRSSVARSGASRA